VTARAASLKICSILFRESLDSPNYSLEATPFAAREEGLVKM